MYHKTAPSSAETTPTTTTMSFSSLPNIRELTRTRILSDLRDQREAYLKCYQLLWLEDNGADDTMNNFDESGKKLKNYVQVFNNCTECVNCLTDATDRKIILIVSKEDAEFIVSVVHDFSQLKAVFIYRMDIKSSVNTEWTKNFNKVKDIVITSIDELAEQLEDLTLHEQTDENSICINIYNDESSKDEIIEEQRNKRNASFMYFQIFIDILMKMKTDHEKSKQDLTTIWRQTYSDNRKENEIIKEFENHYDSTRAVWWYTRNGFLYRSMNKALREYDTDIMFAMRFFLCDLQRQLIVLHEKIHQSPISEPVFRVYRGQNISYEELNLIRASQNKLLTFNSFLSTSRDRQVASMFGECSSRTNHVSVLFEIEIDTRLKDTKPYADISTASYFHDEKEVLIMLGSIFQIEKVEYNKEEKNWMAKLSLCSESKFALKQLMARIKQESGDGIYSLGFLLYKQGDLKKAKYFFEGLLNENATLTPSEMLSCYGGLGGVARRMNQLNEALLYYRHGLSLYETNDGNELAKVNIYYGIGEVLCMKDELEQALSYIEKALAILLPSNDRRLSDIYGVIASIHSKKKQHNQAIQYYEKAIEFDRSIKLPEEHPNFGNNYKNMATTYMSLHKWEEAQECFTKAHNIFIKSLGPNDPRISDAKQGIEHSTFMLNLRQDLNLSEEELQMIVLTQNLF